MHITVNLKGYYEWLPIKDGTFVPPEGDPNYKTNTAGQVLEKVRLTGETHTSVALPEDAIADCVACAQRKGATKSRAQVAAYFLQEVVMPHHAHPEDFQSIEVAGEPDVERFLNLYFSLQKAGA